MARLQFETVRGDTLEVSMTDNNGHLCILNAQGESMQGIIITHQDWLRLNTFVTEEYFRRASEGKAIDPPHPDKETADEVIRE